MVGSEYPQHIGCTRRRISSFLGGVAGEIKDGECRCEEFANKEIAKAPKEPLPLKK
jgi:hypothetical protein